MEHTDVLLPLHTTPAPSIIGFEETASTSKPFIEANTIPLSFEEVKTKHVIPVFVKDNEPLISHADFVDSVSAVAADVFHGEAILRPLIRVSHPIKGRIPSAKDKPANQLLESEKTLYYERMAFVIEIPSISDNIDGNVLSLTVAGVKAYNLDNLYSRSTCDQHFKMVVGFQNKVCTNLCLWTDGTMLDIKVKTIGQLRAAVYTLLQGYNMNYHLFHLKKFPQYSITEKQFANLLGRCRMYQHLPGSIKTDIPVLQFNDTQVNTICRDYYQETSFCKGEDGQINLWRLYNLFTGSNKSSYIDSFLDRSINAFNLVDHIRRSIDEGSSNWYLN